jgi:hypothetical protein
LTNAAAIINYQSQSVYQRYYQLHWLRPSGNLLSQYLLIALSPIGGLEVAQKILLSLYTVSLPLSFCYLLGKWTSQAWVFCFFGALLTQNLFLHMGFWNFCISVPLGLLALGYFARHYESWSRRAAMMTVLLGLLVYAAHVFSWLVLGGAAGVLAIHAAWKQRSVRQLSISAAILFPPGILWLIYSLDRGQRALTLGPDWRVRLWRIYGGSFLHTVAPADLLLAKLFVVGTALMFALSVFRLFRNRPFKCEGVPFLIAAGGLFLLTLATPDSVGMASYLPDRAAFYAWAFLLFWMAVQPWPAWFLRVVTVSVCAFVLIGLMGRVLVYQRWNNTLGAFVELAKYVPPGSTLLPAILQSVASGPDPAFHASGFLTSGGVVDLSNYEAATDYFLINFRPDRSPFQALGTFEQVTAIPPVFDILRYETVTRGSVDFILFQGGYQANGRWPEQTLYAGQIGGYEMIAKSEPGSIARLYRRRLRTGPSVAAAAP